MGIYLHRNLTRYFKIVSSLANHTHRNSYVNKVNSKYYGSVIIYDDAHISEHSSQILLTWLGIALSYIFRLKSLLLVYS